MKTKFSGILTLLLAFVVQLSFAQGKTISGTVSDQSGMPLPGVNIIVKGTTNGTQTDFDGNYTINVSEGAVLTFSYVGLKTVERTVGATNTINVTMEEDAAVLDEVVVTAFGISKEKKALGYAVSVVGAEEIIQKPETDIARLLNGKISGVQITGTGGAAGSSTNIVVRSKISVTGTNQPLYIVDGIPFGSDTDAAGDFTVSTAGSSRFLDLDPNNIEEISVLKGLSASTLYGNQGRNGVILITTKSGTAKDTDRKFEVDFTQTTYITEISNLPEFQNTYGQGADNVYNGGFVGNWGARFDSIEMVPHPYGTGRIDYTEIFPELQIMIPYEAAPNNVRDFFRTGVGSTTSIGVRKGGESSSFNMNFGLTNEDGFIPENSMQRLNFSVGGSAKLANNFTFTGSISFNKTGLKTPPISAGNGGGYSIYERLLYIPRNVDLGAYPYENPFDGSSTYYRSDLENPYWLLNNAGDTQDIRRAIVNFGLNYAFNDNINLNYRYGYDTYNDTSVSYINKGGVTNVRAQDGYLRESSAINEIIDHNLTLNFSNYKLTDKIGFSALLGFNARSDSFNRVAVASTNQIVFGVVKNWNFEDQLGSSFESLENNLGLYGQLEFDYDQYLFLSVTGRNDWNSTLLKDNQSLLYSGATLSFIPTSAFENIKSDTFQYLKFRAGYGTSAGFPNPYLVNQALNAQANRFTDVGGGGTITNSLSSFFPNPNLKPELHSEVELGLEATLFNGFVNLDASIFKRISKDQILFSNPAPSTGASSSVINAGRIDTEGLELEMTFNPFRKGDFNWSIVNNFTAYESIVKELPEERIYMAGFGNLGNFAIVGQPLGVLVGDYMVRDDEGNTLINPTDGKILISSDLGLPDEIIGDPNPDWNWTMINSFSYKNLNLSFQLEYQQGGDIYSTTAQLLLLRGVTRDTEQREGPYVIPGVLADPATGSPLLDGNGDKIRNNIQIGANDLYFINLLNAAGNNVYDATNLRIRDITLSYNLPTKFLDKTPFGSLSIALSGQNLWFKAFNFPKYLNFDPETLSTGVGNGAGIDFMTGPSSKKYSLSIKATF